MLKLHDFLDSGNGYKVRLLLALLGEPFELIEHDITRGETRTPEYLAMNANGRIPLLQTDDGEFLPESNAILFYLADGTRFLPTERMDRARVLQWMFFEQYSHEPNIATSRFLHHHRDMTDEVRALLDSRRKPGYAALDVMEGHLAGCDYFVGATYSIADIALRRYPPVAHESGFDLAGHANIRDWLARVALAPGHVPITQR